MPRFSGGGASGEVLEAVPRASAEYVVLNASSHWTTYSSPPTHFTSPSVDRMRCLVTGKALALGFLRKNQA